ncbi:MAG: hypothetical protein HY052_03010 [Proteobacteria bacterium]|nr:hypothetical protein [Pseudomonadota bacterium]
MTVRHFSRGAGLFAVALLLAPSQAQAQSVDKLGKVVSHLVNDVTGQTSTFGVQDVFSVAAWVIGIFYAVSGVFKFKDHVDQPAQHPLSAGVKRMLAGGALFSLPWSASTAVGTLTGGNSSAVDTSGHDSLSAPTDGIEKAIYSFVSDVSGPAMDLLSAFAYISAVVFLIVGITRLTKTAQEGPRGPAGLGTLAQALTFLFGGALAINMGGLIDVIQNSVGITNAALTFN